MMAPSRHPADTDRSQRGSRFPRPRHGVARIRANVYKPPDQRAIRASANSPPPDDEPRRRPGFHRAFLQRRRRHDGRGIHPDNRPRIGEETNVAQFKELADAVGATLGCSRHRRCRLAPQEPPGGQSARRELVQALHRHGCVGRHPASGGMKHVSTIVAVNSMPGVDLQRRQVRSRRRYFEIAEELRRLF